MKQAHSFWQGGGSYPPCYLLLNHAELWLEKHLEMVRESRRKYLIEVQEVVMNVYNRVKTFPNDQEAQRAFEFLGNYVGKGRTTTNKKAATPTTPTTPTKTDPEK